MSIELKIDLLRVGHTRQAEKFARKDGAFSIIDFPALCALIRHPLHGAMLYDTGYDRHFEDATRHYPLKLYRDVLPVHLEERERLCGQLRERGTTPEDIRHIIISHFHADHIAGLKSFPNTRYMCFRKDHDGIACMCGKPWRSLKHGLVPELLPVDFVPRARFAEDLPTRPLPDWMKPFDTGYDLWGDGSMLGVPLPGHALGQLGLLLPETDKGRVFLIADACWSLPACRKGILPWQPALWTAADRTPYHHTFFRIRDLANRETGLKIMPSHCTESWEAWHA